MQTNSPRAISRDTFSRAVMARLPWPNTFVTPSRVTKGAASSATTDGRGASATFISREPRR